MTPHRVEKGWGYELWAVNKPEYCGKILFFQAGKRCSLHYHKIKDETFYLHSGKIVLLIQNTGEFSGVSIPQLIVMSPGETYHIPRLMRHQMLALEDSELFEFSTQHFEEDSYRIVKGD